MFILNTVSLTSYCCICIVDQPILLYNFKWHLKSSFYSIKAVTSGPVLYNKVCSSVTVISIIQHYTQLGTKVLMPRVDYATVALEVVIHVSAVTPVAVMYHSSNLCRTSYHTSPSPMKKLHFNSCISNRTLILCTQALELYVKTTSRALLSPSFSAEITIFTGAEPIIFLHSCNGTAGEVCWCFSRCRNGWSAAQNTCNNYDVRISRQAYFCSLGCTVI